MIRTLRWPLVVVLIFSALALAACADDEEDGDVLDGADVTETPIAEETPTLENGEETPAPEDGEETPTPEDGEETPTSEDGDEAGGADETVAATLSDFAIDIGQTPVPSGSVTFTLENTGTVEHNFIVIRTDMAADELPVENAQVVLDELEVVGRTDSNVPPGETAEVTMELEPGDNYVVICNVVGHYELGMYTDMTVE